MEPKSYAETWNRLLSDRRVRQVGDEVELVARAAEADGRSPFEIDYERVVFASPFRRLARKTQVHPFAEVDHIHNRLTHSLEVASVGLSLAKRVGAFLVARGDLTPAQADAVCWIVQAAGLAHDIGNPAYGHSGEQAIQSWAEGRRDQLDGDPVWTDFRVFDGNAQAFRLLARSDTRPTAYFRFTLASLGALVKHPRLASSFAEDPEGERKLAAFTSEEVLFRRIWQEMGLVRADGTFMRHPLSFLTEAADDICYRILDFEDAVTLDIFPHDEIAELFRTLLPPVDRAQSAGMTLQWLRARAIHDLIRAFSEQFEAHYGDIMSGAFSGELKDLLEGETRAAFAEIKARYAVLFANHRKVIAEIGSYGQFALILDHYHGFLQAMPAEGGAPALADMTALHRHLVQLAWGPDFYAANRGRPRAWWAHAVLDFVSGMTDDYLNTLAHRLGK